jgi:hypothetical protein
MNNCKSFRFRSSIPRGTPLNQKENPQLLSAEEKIPFWGELISYEAKVFRDGSPAMNVSTYSVGVRLQVDLLTLKFQIWDTTVQTVADHDYVVEADFHIRH